MYLKRSTTVKYILAAVIGAALYCEWFIYKAQPWYWHTLECENPGACIKVLFIADPQIQGDLAVSPPMSYIINWDSDRYLKSTFSVALKHFKPDVLVYMGDLMDEGSVATIPQFHGYVKRLSNIFDIDYPIVQIWLPGDNDIGGENEAIKNDKVLEFEKVFNQPSIITFRNVSFYKVNVITYIRSFPTQPEEDNNLKIVVSHYPVTYKHSFGNQVMNAIHPSMFFCAHDHDSKYVKQSKDLTNRVTRFLHYGDSVLDIVFDEETVFEIYVPTCSYRMGTDKIGFGAAVFENHQRMQYTVFWSPKRFPYLKFYLGISIFLCIYIVIFSAARLLHRHPRPAKHGIDKQPLLQRL